MGRLARPITPDEVAAYNNAGVVLLRGVLDLRTVNTLRNCIDDVVRNLEQSASGYDITAITRAAEKEDDGALKSESEGQHDIAGIVKHFKSSGKPFLFDDTQQAKGSYFIDTGIASRLKEFRRITVSGALPEIAGALLGAEQVNFYGDQVFVKEPDTRERTAFHQDATYFNLEGDQCCVFWVPVDPVTLENGAMLYLRGSHKDGKLYQPNVFFSQATLPGAEGEVLPDIEGDLDAYDIVHFDVEPGDIIVHHYRTVHGTGGNLSRYQVRRAASIRYCGDDMRFRTRPGAVKQLHHTQQLKDGDPLGGPDFPVVWTRREDPIAA